MERKISALIIFIFITSIAISASNYNQLTAQVQIELANNNYKKAYKLLLPAIKTPKSFSASNYENILWYAALCCFKENNIDTAEDHYRKLILSKKQRLGKNSSAFKKQLQNLIKFLIKEGYQEKAKKLSRLI